MLLFILMAMACSKSSDNDAKDDEVKVTTETTGGITYKLFVKKEPAAFKGILVMGSGNDAENPSLGSLDGAAENELCQKAAQNNYVAAIVQYRKTPGLANWDASSTMIADDYDKCIVTLANHFDIQKERSVIGGYSYAAYMLLNNAA